MPRSETATFFQREKNSKQLRSSALSVSETLEFLERLYNDLFGVGLNWPVCSF